MVIQWLKLHASGARGMTYIPGQRSKIPHALGHGKKKKKKISPGERFQIK